MNRFRILLTLLLVSICTLQGVQARKAPEFPQPVSLESGKTYYMFNLGSQMWIYRSTSGSSNYLRTSPTTRHGVQIKATDGLFSLSFSNEKYYFSCNTTTDVYLRSSFSDSYCYFRIAQSDGGYTIQRNYSYNESHFLGNDSESSYIYSNITEGNIIWQLFDVDEVDHYDARKALYDALEAAGDYSFALADYEAIYENEASTTEELNQAANKLNNSMTLQSSVYKDSEYPIFIDADWTVSTKYSSEIYKYATDGNEATCKATVVVDEDATLWYYYTITTRDAMTGSNYYSSEKKGNGRMTVYLDGVEVESIATNEGRETARLHFVELTAGQHTIEWRGSESDNCYFNLNDFCVRKTPTISVTLSQAGSLGTEILYNVDHVKDVRKLVIKGNMNSDDWERVNMMTELYELDLTDANVASLPKLNGSGYLHKIKLPKVLKEIQAEALSDIPLTEIVLPEGLTTIGKYAFSRTSIKKIDIPSTVNSIGSGAFQYNFALEQVNYPASMTTIPAYCFQYCYALKSVKLNGELTSIEKYSFNKTLSLTDFAMPDGLVSIGENAFNEANAYGLRIPSTVTSIGNYAFYQSKIDVLNFGDNVDIGKESFYDCDSLKSVVMGKNCSIRVDAFRDCTSLEKIVLGDGVSFESNYSSSRYYAYTFADCTSLKEVEFPSSYYNIDFTNLLYNCKALEKVSFRSPIMMQGSQYKSFFSGLGYNITLCVPQFLVNSYKLDPYWYNYPIEGFSTGEMSDWVINSTLTFYSQDRFDGTPNVTVNSNGSWTVNGDLAQNVQDLYISGSGRVLSNCNNMRIQDRLQMGKSVSTGSWYFWSLPFDIKVSDITCTDNALFAIRYYDGAGRAAYGTGNNWKNYANDAIITAGSGFIMQFNKACTVYFKAIDNSTKQNIVSNQMFTKTLESNHAEMTANKGWNLVGNPWQTYYNIHKMNFTAPITVYSSGKYSAYSVIDDDYAISPNEAFFVQCPDEVNEISFPVEGRQITSVIEDQNGARREVMPVAKKRRLIDIELSNGEETDKTRFVLNPEASADYELSCDASKFFEAETSCPQIYTIEQEISLAINERPTNNGKVQLGIIAPEAGSYTIGAQRNQFDSIILIDKETGVETDLSTNNYTFYTTSGRYENRFVLSLTGGVVTVITSPNNVQADKQTYYNLNGQNIGSPKKGVYIVNGKKMVIN